MQLTVEAVCCAGCQERESSWQHQLRPGSLQGAATVLHSLHRKPTSLHGRLREAFLTSNPAATGSQFKVRSLRWHHSYRDPGVQPVLSNSLGFRAVWRDADEGHLLADAFQPHGGACAAPRVLLARRSELSELELYHEGRYGEVFRAHVSLPRPQLLKSLHIG